MDCEYNDLEKMTFKRIIIFLLKIISLVMLLFFVVAGIVVITHINNAKQALLKQQEEPSTIVCFIDDDTGKYIPEIWGPIIDSTHIKMGFACITGFMDGKRPYSEVFDQMDSTYLRKLYNEGHDVYSHTFSHQQFFVDTVTTEMIDFQCRTSKEWMDSNGYTRNSDIIVYPGGLGRGRWGKNIIASYKGISKKDAKRDVVRKYYKYGVDAIGFKPNHEPFDNYCILRVNADTSSLTSLKDKVDEAIDTKGLLVFMNHAYELQKDKQNQMQKMLDIIAYCRQREVKIMPLSEALKIRGNSIAVDDYVSPFCLYVSKNGYARNGYMNVAFIESLIIIIESIFIFFILYIFFFKKRNE